MITIYGIKNCGTMKKAMTWLEDNGIDYVFHNYKESGIDKQTLKTWLRHFPLDKLVNTRGTTYRNLSDEEKEQVTSKTKALAIMQEYTSLIKRPVWDFGNGTYVLGWDEDSVKEAIDAI